ncbi:hypothetical protein Poli38472_005445 [Pythium oligandrum]|uniref:Uncharacterized protein n=1 Tax=Pythium oligandrum TaxID=41045 RepID=A0A8K1CGB7_PYTOL|nr:hypothetical protein Poli38472_005445 [Pythium oligandrum]|eukprot:TMW62827.1 hypothetical protein Poli38472_005445 [Pythium oligandrum]
MKRDEAIAYFQHKVEENPMDPDPHHNLAVLYRSMGDQENHARHARIAVLTKEGGPKVWNEMALSLMEQGKYEEAKEKFAQVIQFWPTFPWAHVNMSVLLARRGECSEALACCLKAVQLAPQDASVHRNVAKVYEALGKTSDALEHYHRALSLVPDDADVAQRIALLSLSKQRTADATVHYDLYRRLTGQHFDVKL